MNKIGWVVVLTLVVMQLAFAFELMELTSLMKRIASIDEKTAIVKNATANKQLENERIRNTYYRVLVTSPFKLTEEEAKGIIRSGVKEESK